MYESKTQETTKRAPASPKPEAQRLAEWWAGKTSTEASLLAASDTLAFNIPRDMLHNVLEAAILRGIKHLNGIRPALQELESDLRRKHDRRMPRPESYTGETIAEILARITSEQIAE